MNTYRPVHGGDCPEDRGCEMPLDDRPRFERPDDAERFPVASETAAGVAAFEATCATVASALASHDLGPYAEEEARAPHVARHEASCLRHRLDADERLCIVESHDRAGAAWCAPRMAPAVKVPIVDPGECAAIVRGVRRATGLPEPADPTWETRLAALEASCRGDRWPLELGACARHAAMVGPMPCDWLAPSMLLRKIERRLAVP